MQWCKPFVQPEMQRGESLAPSICPLGLQVAEPERRLELYPCEKSICSQVSTVPLYEWGVESG